MSIEPLEVPPAPGDQAPLVDQIVGSPEVPSGAATDQAPPTGSRRQRRAQVRARKVTRIVRRVEPWSVLKASAVLYLCLWLVLTVAGVILWQVARATGTLDNFEDFLATALADTSFTIDGRRVLVSSLTAGVVIVFAGTGLTVLLAVLFNLVSELTGGVRVSVVELETATAVDDAGSPDRRSVR